MKRLLAAFLAALMLALALAGCGSASTSPSFGINLNPPGVTTTVTPTAQLPANDHVVDYRLNIPSRFTPLEPEDFGIDADAFWYRSGGSSITVTTEPRDSTDTLEGFLEISVTDFHNQQQIALGPNTQLTDLYFTRDDVSGLPALQYAYKTTSDGQTSYAILVSVLADPLYFFGFAAADAETMLELEQCSKNIQLIFG